MAVTEPSSSLALDDLVAAARAGGGWAFGRLWELLAPKVRGYLLARGAREPDDLTSEVFLQAFRGLGRFEGDGESFKRWLFTIAHRRLVDELRGRARHGVEQAYDGVLDPRRSPSAEDDALARLLPERLRDSLAVLTPDQRDVLLLRVLGELSIEEIATATGRGVSATKSLLRRALETLRSPERVNFSADGSRGRTSTIPGTR